MVIERLYIVNPDIRVASLAAGITAQTVRTFRNADFCVVGSGPQRIAALMVFVATEQRMLAVDYDCERRRLNGRPSTDDATSIAGPFLEAGLFNYFYLHGCEFVSR